MTFTRENFERYAARCPAGWREAALAVAHTTAEIVTMPDAVAEQLRQRFMPDPPKRRPGLGDLVAAVATPIARALKLPCIAIPPRASFAPSLPAPNARPRLIASSESQPRSKFRLSSINMKITSPARPIVPKKFPSLLIGASTAADLCAIRNSINMKTTGPAHPSGLEEFPSLLGATPDQTLRAISAVAIESSRAIKNLEDARAVINGLQANVAAALEQLAKEQKSIGAAPSGPATLPAPPKLQATPPAPLEGEALISRYMSLSGATRREFLFQNHANIWKALRARQPKR